MVLIILGRRGGKTVEEAGDVENGEPYSRQPIQ
jgi:hypothetical protein